MAPTEQPAQEAGAPFNWLSDDRVRSAFNDALDDLLSQCEGRIASSLSKYPSLTAIEFLAYVDLLKISIGETISGYEPVIIVPQFPIGRYTVDFMIEYFGERFTIECDGHDFHERTKYQAARDKSRDRFIQSKGFKVFRFTGSEIWAGDWDDDVLAELDAIKERARHRSNGG